MKKKYLTTIEDLLALKDTDTKIYCENITSSYCQFVGGVLCIVFADKTATFNASITVDENYYILEEEPVKDANENDIGKLCWFWDDDFADKMYGILEDFGEDTQTKKISYYCKEARWYDHCHRLTTKEVAEITGYKVEK